MFKLTRLSIVAVALCLGFGLSAARAADAVDRTNAKATAAAILTAYKAKDYKAMSELATTTNKKILAELAEQGEKHKRYKSLFGGFRWEAISKWDGKTLDEPRYNKDRAWVKFAEGEEKRAVVVSLKSEDGGKTWAFDDVNNKEADALEKESKTPTKAP
jgi:hypothetical protein